MAVQDPNPGVILDLSLLSHLQGQIPSALPSKYIQNLSTSYPFLLPPWPKPPPSHQDHCDGLLTDFLASSLGLPQLGHSGHRSQRNLFKMTLDQAPLLLTSFEDLPSHPEAKPESPWACATWVPASPTSSAKSTFPAHPALAPLASLLCLKHTRYPLSQGSCACPSLRVGSSSPGKHSRSLPISSSLCSWLSQGGFP